ncbi:hypothetical protein BC833DRAFT_528245 [Globomyces pollinis-pini]|nr:hypothetical protein BC833DRAFT_528245 [Globomyces pollinis-pini]
MTTEAKSPNGEFKAGLFDCFDNLGTCLLSWCCPCVVYGQNQAALKNGDGCFVSGCTFVLATYCGCHSCIGAYGRGIIRENRGIEGGFVGDCLTHLCCTACALTQERTELVHAGKQF